MGVLGIKFHIQIFNVGSGGEIQDLMFAQTFHLLTESSLQPPCPFSSRVLIFLFIFHIDS